jgi:propionyl-CoA synthetase
MVVLTAGVDAGAGGCRIGTELVKWVRDEAGLVAALHQVDIVAALPKTRSGKILRKTMREIADGKQATVPGTIEDASVLDTLRPVLRPQP